MTPHAPCPAYPHPDLEPSGICKQMLRNKPFQSLLLKAAPKSRRCAKGRKSHHAADAPKVSRCHAKDESLTMPQTLPKSPGATQRLTVSLLDDRAATLQCSPKSQRVTVFLTVSSLPPFDRMCGNEPRVRQESV